MSTRFLRHRSTQAPAGRPMTRKARNWKVSSRPIWSSLASRTRTASTGSASTVSWVPTWLIVSPIQSWRKSWWWNSPHRERTRSGSNGASALVPSGGSAVTRVILTH